MENKNVTVVNQDGMEVVTKEKVISYLDAMGMSKKLTNEQKGLFIGIAQASNLNPFKKEIYPVPYKSGNGYDMGIITSYTVYIKRAERTGKLDGWSSGVKKDDNGELVGWVRIYRKDWSHEHYTEVPIGPMRKNNTFWNNDPRWMIEKCAISRGFRLCFPDELGHLPYTESEYDPTAERNVTPVDNPINMQSKDIETKEEKEKSEYDKIMNDDILAVIETLSEETKEYAKENGQYMDSESYNWCLDIKSFAENYVSRTMKTPIPVIQSAFKRLKGLVQEKQDEEIPFEKPVIEDPTLNDQRDLF